MRPESDGYLVRYLLGDVPAEEADRLDERSITDDEFALRLRELENDLMDRIARGDASDATLQQIERKYRHSAYGRDKVRFAAALQALPSSAQTAEPIGTGKLVQSPLAWAWLAAAAVLIFALAGYLGLRNMRLRDDVERLEAGQAVVEQRNVALQQELERARATPSARAFPLTATVLLRPPRRSLADDVAVSIPPGTEQVVLRVQIESDAHQTFWAALRDPASSDIVWRSPDVRAEGTGSEPIITLTVPAGTFRPQRYTLELTGVSGTGSGDSLGHYPLRVVLE